MKRRILLVLTTLGGLLAAFYVYSLVAGLDILPRRQDGPSVRRDRARNVRGTGGTSIEDADDICIIARDRLGRLEAIYRAAKWHRRDDGSHLLIQPRVELYHRGGQRTILRADHADVYGEELDRGVNIRRAKLRGNVTIYFDPETEPDRTSPEQRPDEVVRVHVDDVEFDNEHFTITTPGRVTVFSPEADIYGHGLSISWNESPRELRLLRIERGQYMAVYNVPAELDVISLPGGGPDATTKPAASQPASRPTTRPASRPAGAAATQPVVVALSRPTTTPASQPTTTSAPARPLPRNQYVAEFHDNVKVVHRTRRLQGAETLSLRFDWDDSWRDRSDYLGTGRRRRRAASQPAKPPANTQPTGGAATRPASRPAKRRPANEPMEIYWSGPLVIRPVGRTPTPARDRYVVTASGPRVVLTDPRATAACREFLFRHPAQTGFLRGAETPVRLLLAEGADVAGKVIRFDPAAGQAELDGPGYMARRFPDGLDQAKALELIETERPGPAPAGERITWAGKVDLRFTTERVRHADGSSRNRQLIRTARFHENVLLQQTQAPGGDYVRCDDLAVEMARGRGGKAYPGKAVATGNVAARQEGADVQAGKVTVHFGEAQAADANADGLDLATSVRPEFVLAEGGVRLTDRRDPNSPPVEASAETITSDLRKRTAVLSGSPARIAQGANELTGPVIRLDQREGSAEADGRGTLRFLTRKDMNGRTLSKPRPVAIAWSKSMSFRGERRTASFAGDVALDGGMDQMRCQDMQILFTEPRPEKPAATRPATTPASPKARSSRFGGMAVGVDKYSRRRISMILADRNVTLRSRRENPKNQLVRRIQLSGDKLIYDAQTSRLTMLRHGTFVAEDYDKPKPRKPGDADELAEAVDRPSQTAFEWNRSMQFSQQDRLVVLDGDVKMVHRSGNQVLLAESLNVPRDQWGPLEAGRKSVLTCGNMMAKFGEPDKKAKPKTRPARGDVLEEGPDLGPLELFSATRDVNLKDGPRQVLAQRLIYNRLNDLAVLWGFLEGQPPANATVLHEDPMTGRSQSWSSSKIIWYRRNNKIVSENVTGAGGR